MNQVTLIGRLTKDPELRYTGGSNKAVADINLAVNRIYKRDGQPDADFFKVTVWGNQAENADKYLAKGSMIAVTGRIENNNYEDKNGVKHYGNVIQAERIEYLSQSKDKADDYSSGVVVEDDFPMIDDDEVPF